MSVVFDALRGQGLATEASQLPAPARITRAAPGVRRSGPWSSVAVAVLVAGTVAGAAWLPQDRTDAAPAASAPAARVEPLIAAVPAAGAVAAPATATTVGNARSTSTAELPLTAVHAPETAPTPAPVPAAAGKDLRTAAVVPTAKQSEPAVTRRVAVVALQAERPAPAGAPVKPPMPALKAAEPEQIVKAETALVATAAPDILPPAPAGNAIAAAPREDVDVRALFRSFKDAANSGQAAQAAILIDKVAAEAGNDSILIARMQAYLALKQGQLDKARRLYADVAARMPDDREATLNLALIDIQQGMPDSARARVRNVLQHNPDDATARSLAASLR